MKLEDKRKLRKPVEREIAKLERRHGVEIVLAAMRHRIALTTAEKKRRSKIHKLQNELEKLKNGKLPVNEW